MTNTFPLSIKEQFSKKTDKRPSIPDIIDAWKNQGNASFKICKAIEEAYIREQNGRKLDSYLNQSKLELLPPSFDYWNKDDLKEIPPADLERLYKVMLQNQALVLNTLRSVSLLR